MITTLKQDDINNIYSDLLRISGELKDIRKCLNVMAMVLRPQVTDLNDTDTELSWEL